MRRFIVFIIIVISLLTVGILLSNNDDSSTDNGFNKVHETEDVISDTSTGEGTESTEPSAVSKDKTDVLEEIFKVKDKRISFELLYENAIEELGKPDKEFGEGGEVYLTYGKVTLQFSAILDEQGDMSDELTQVIREDIFSNRSEVESILGSPNQEEYIKEIGTSISTYRFDGYILDVWVNSENVVDSVRLVKEYPDSYSNGQEEWEVEQVVEQDNEVYENTVEISNEPYDPNYEVDQLANFSKTVRIGDDESIVRDYMGSPSSSGETLTIYDSSPIRFIISEGKVAYISWGRSGLFEQWETKEGIGRGSTINQATVAYKNFNYTLLYEQGNTLPSYMKIDNEGNFLIFEFSEGLVSFIFLCSPEMLEESFIKDTAFTFDELREEPF